MEIQIREMPVTSGWPKDEDKYKKLLGKSGRTWLIKIGKFSADRIYTWTHPNNEGFGGSILTFELEDGTALSLKGPWLCNSKALFGDTGYDIRDKHATKVLIAEKVEYKSGHWKPFLSGILHKDEESQEGPFERGDNLAKDYANKLGKSVFYYVETGGGSHSGWIHPEGTK